MRRRWYGRFCGGRRRRGVGRRRWSLFHRSGALGIGKSRGSVRTWGCCRHGGGVCRSTTGRVRRGGTGRRWPGRCGHHEPAPPASLLCLAAAQHQHGPGALAARGPLAGEGCLPADGGPQTPRTANDTPVTPPCNQPHTPTQNLVRKPSTVSGKRGAAQTPPATHGCRNWIFPGQAASTTTTQ